MDKNSEKLTLNVIMKYLYTNRFMDSPIFPGRNSFRLPIQMKFLESIFPKKILKYDTETSEFKEYVNMWGNDITRSKIFNGKIDDKRSGLKDFRKLLLSLLRIYPELIVDINKNCELALVENNYSEENFERAIVQILEPHHYNISDTIKGFISTRLHISHSETLTWLILFTLLEDGIEIIANPNLKNDSTLLVQHCDKNQYIIDIETAKSFSNCGKTRSVIEFRIENDELCVSINFNPTKVRPEIPNWCSIVFIQTPQDITKYKELVFDMKLNSGDCNEIQIEMKPFEKRWMHYLKEMNFTTEWKTYKILLSEVEERTLKNFEELCFVTKCDFFTGELLTVEYSIRNIYFNR
jgi:hypothetical protein